MPGALEPPSLFARPWPQLSLSSRCMFLSLTLHFFSMMYGRGIVSCTFAWGPRLAQNSRFPMGVNILKRVRSPDLSGHIKPEINKNSLLLPPLLLLLLLFLFSHVLTTLSCLCCCAGGCLASGLDWLGRSCVSQGAARGEIR